jgi:hypothetical protein
MNGVYTLRTSGLIPKNPEFNEEWSLDMGCSLIREINLCLTAEKM